MSIAATASAQTAAPDALNDLRNSGFSANWDANTRVVADVSCDGMADTPFVGYEKGAVWLGVVLGSKSPIDRKILAMRFGVAKDDQGSFCATPVKLSASPMKCRTEDGPLPGCRQVKGCSALSMADDACDSFHFYWDDSRKSLTWWRR